MNLVGDSVPVHAGAAPIPISVVATTDERRPAKSGGLEAW